MSLQNAFKRELGKELGCVRRTRLTELSKVFRDTNIPLELLDQLEIGMPKDWIYYGTLLFYYGKVFELKLVDKITEF